MTPRLLLALLTAAVAAVLSAPAASASGLAIEPSASARFPERTMVLSLPAKQPLTAGEVRLREDGTPVRGLRVEPVSGSHRTGTVLVIDTSQSMHGEAIRRAMAAARAFARRRPPGAPLGVIFFARTPRIVLAPTTDGARIAAVLSRTPALSRGTRLLDAAAAGVRLLARTAVPAGAVVLLSDGADYGSATTLDGLGAVAHRTRTRIFTVGLRSASASAAILAAAARAGHGTFTGARTSRDLPKVFAALGDRLAAEYLVTYRSDAPLGENVLVQARVSGVPGRALTTYDTPPLPTDYRPGRLGVARSAALGASAMAALAALAALLAGACVFWLVRPRTRSLSERVGDFAGTGGPAVVRRRRERRPRERTRRMRALAEQLELAGIGLSPEAFVLLVTLVKSVVIAGAIVAGRGIVAILALGIPLGARALVRWRVAHRRRQFDEQLPDTLQLVASALRAGHSFAGALEHASEDAPEPVRTELQRAVADERVGVPVDEALAAVGVRMASSEIEYVGVVARQQSQSGGNSAEVLDRVVATTRERQMLRRQVRTLTAQGRLGGSVVSALPLGLVALFAVIRPGYLSPLLSTSLGATLIVAGSLLLAVGWVWIRKIVNIEI